MQEAVQELLDHVTESPVKVRRLPALRTVVTVELCATIRAGAMDGLAMRLSRFDRAGDKACGHGGACRFDFPAHAPGSPLSAPV
jgi:hypothetical protein